MKDPWDFLIGLVVGAAVVGGIWACCAGYASDRAEAAAEAAFRAAVLERLDRLEAGK